MIANTKLAKEFKTMLASATKAKSLAEQELEKIDAKYKALADKEKADLNKTVKMLDAQIASYTSLIGEEEEPAVVDTVFPENNEVKETAEEPGVETPAPAPAEPASDETPESETAVEADPEELDWSGSNSDAEDEWPEMAEEWK